MIDPLTAIGVASSIVQLVDFSSKVVARSAEIRRAGSSVEVAHLRAITTDLQGLTENLRERSRDQAEDTTTREEQALDDLIPQCTAKADELIAVLRKLTREKDAGTWQSVRAAIETIWDKEKIDVLSTQLHTLRQELALRILVLLNAKNDAQASLQTHRFDHLDRQTRDIVEVVSINQSVLGSAIAKHAKESQGKAVQNDVVAKHRHEEVIAAILTLRDGDTQTLTRSSIPGDAATSDTAGTIAQTSMVIREGTDSAEFTSTWGPEEKEDYVVRGPLPATITLGDYSPIPRKVLDSIYFRQITERADEVATAHQETFQWTYCDPIAGQKSWDNFPMWLEEGSGCYWISGKAGSGKSTLMKFIYRDERTQQHLQAWAGRRGLLTASFFFWNVGTSLQKSQSGLLRSLLFDILDKAKHLIPSVLSSLCRAAVAEQSQSLPEPSLAELKKAFRNLITQKVTPLKICLFIDGLDEYEGDHTELCDFFTQVTASPHFKIVLSSRPIPACIEAFSQCAKLRLQDLTYDDIKLYVEGKLGGHPNIHKLEALEGPATIELVENITKKASGVFLWVMLVVKSLLQGLQNFDHIADLQRRVDMLPADLENLYRQMFQSMSPIYKEQASQLLQLVLRSAEVQTQGQLTLLQLSYAEEEDPDKAVRAPLRELSNVEKDLRCEAVEGRLRSRCCGLVEVQERAEEEGCLSSAAKYVCFLHKTVGDFLRMESVWHDIVSLTAAISFNVDAMLLSSCLHEAKVLPIESEIILESDRVFIDVHHSLAYSTLVETTERRPCRAYLDELEKAASRHWAPVKRYKMLNTDEAWEEKGETQWAALLAKQRYSWQRWQTPINSFIALTALYGSVLYAADRAQKDSYLDVNAVRPCIKGDPSDPNNYTVISAISIIYRLLPPETLHSRQPSHNISDDMVFIKLTHARIVKFMAENGASLSEISSPKTSSSVRGGLERNRSSRATTLVASPLHKSPGGSWWSSTLQQESPAPVLASPGGLRRKWSKFVGGIVT